MIFETANRLSRFAVSVQGHFYLHGRTGGIMNQRSVFWEYLQQVPVVDTHEHFHRFTDSQGYDDLVSFLYFNSYACIPAVYFPQKTVDIITDKTCDEKERFDAFCRFYEKIRYTQTGRTIRNIVRLWGIDDVTTENYVKLQTGYANRLQTLKMPEQICAYIVNTAGHPLYGYVRGLKDYLAGKMPSEDKCYVNTAITGLHSFSKWEEITDVAYAADMEIGCVEELIAAVQRIMAACIRVGAVGFKDVYIYFRSWDIGLPDRIAAQKDFEKIRKGGISNGALSDYMFYQAYDICSQLRVPMGIHTGMTLTSAEPASNLGTLYPVIRAFPDLAFDLYHFNYPMLDLYVQMMRSCPNVYANGAFATGFQPEYAKEFLREALRNIPTERVLAYGGDCHCAGEMTQITLIGALRTVHSVLTNAMEEGYLSLGEAEEVARIWLGESAKTLYGI